VDPLIAPVTFDDAAAFDRLGTEAFGPYPSRPRTPEAWPPAGTHPWGTAVDGALVARAMVLPFRSWFHGALVPTTGLAGVAVTAEHRGSGLLRPLVTAVLAEARERGEVISTLFPSSAGIYRSLGYEIVGSVDTATIPMSALAAVPAPATVRTRRAEPDDLDALHAVYTAWASGQNGPLSRATDDNFAMTAAKITGDDDGATGVTLAVTDDGEVVGFADWHRGQGYESTNAVVVRDLVSLTPDAARSLWRVLGSFSAVAGSVRLTTSGGWSGTDPARLVLPNHAATVTSEPYMLRVLDVVRALETARLAPLTAQVPFAVADPRTPDLDGSWVLEVAAGSVRVTTTPHDSTGLVFTAAGLALSYAGAQSCANLRLAGHLRGPADLDTTWDALWGGRQVHVRDDF
jgi:predicted acetyltransferase